MKKVYNKNGKEMVHPDIARDACNDSFLSYCQWTNYRADYEEAKKRRS